MLIAQQQNIEWESENKRSDRVLDTLFPPRIRHNLHDIIGTCYLEYHEIACIISIDIVGYTNLSSHVSPALVIDLLNNMFVQFDELCNLHNMEKVMTMGDGYLAFSTDALFDFQEELLKGNKQGLRLDANDVVQARANKAVSACFVALAIQNEVMPILNASFRAKFHGEEIKIRAGIHTGELRASILGGSHRFKYEIFGKNVTKADKIQQTCNPGECD
jgi:class 3 adenylate cyclase